MTENTPEASTPIFLGEAEARAWFMRRRGGQTILDDHVTAIHNVFGPNTQYRIEAAANPSTGLPSVLVISIAAPSDDPAAWERLVALQRVLLEREPELAIRSRADQPLRRIVVALGDPPDATVDQMLAGTVEP